MSNWLIDSFIAVNENSASIGVIEAEILMSNPQVIFNELRDGCGVPDAIRKMIDYSIKIHRSFSLPRNKQVLQSG